MQIRVAAACALAALAASGALYAQVANGPELTVTGQVVSTGNTSLVLYKDAGGEVAGFVVTTTTQLPRGLAAGDRVTVYYRPIGDRHVAERVVAAPPIQPQPTETERPSEGGGGPNAGS